jgi:hypothetical protein
MSSATEPALRSAPVARAVAIGLVALLLPHPLSPLAAAGTPAELRSILEKTDKTLAQAEKAVQGKDPGKVGFLLIRVDELLASFQETARLEDLIKAFDGARATAALASDLAAAAAAVRKASDLMNALNDYVLLRQAAESSRSALRAAEAHDSAAFLEALDRLESSVLAPVLLARVREARAAVARARQAMVHNNMQDGRARIAEVRRAVNGLIHAGALSRSAFSLAMGAELLESGSVISARDQMQKAMRDLKLAAEVGPDDTRPALEEARAKTVEIWKRSGHALQEDAARLAELARTIETIRLKQPR